MPREVESIIAEKERRKIEEERRQEEERRHLNEERRRQEEEQRLREELRIKDLEIKSQKMKEEILMIDEQQSILKERRCELVKERQQVEIERNQGTSNHLFGDNDLMYPNFVTNSAQQSDLQSSFIDEIVKENEELKAEVEQKTIGIHTIQGSDKRTKFYTGLPSWGVFLHISFCLQMLNHQHLSA